MWNVTIGNFFALGISRKICSINGEMGNTTRSNLINNRYECENGGAVRSGAVCCYCIQTEQLMYKACFVRYSLQVIPQTMTSYTFSLFVHVRSCTLCFVTDKGFTPPKHFASATRQGEPTMLQTILVDTWCVEQTHTRTQWQWSMCGSMIFLLFIVYRLKHGVVEFQPYMFSYEMFVSLISLVFPVLLLL